MPGLRSRPTTLPVTPTCGAARCATRDIENPLTRIERRMLNKKRRPWPKDAGYQMALVDFWRVSPKLPSFLFTHLSSHVEETAEETHACHVWESFSQHLSTIAFEV
jgi:hypothetical protein